MECCDRVGESEGVAAEEEVAPWPLQAGFSHIDSRTRSHKHWEGLGVLLLVLSRIITISEDAIDNEAFANCRL